MKSMTKNKYNIPKIKFLILLIIVILPLVGLLFTMISSSPTLGFEILNIRRLKVIFKSLAFSYSVAIITALLGLFLSIIVYLYKKIIYPLFLLLLFFMAIPPYIHTIGWIEFSSVFFNKPILSGFLISIFVQVLYFLPFAAIICYMGVLSIDKSYFDVCKLETEPIKAAITTITHLSYLPVIMAFSTIFLLSLNDYTIPSIFAFNTYPIEIMTIFASNTNLLDTMLVSIPYLFISLLGVSIVYFIFRKYYSSIDIKEDFVFPKVKINYFIIIFSYIIIILQTFIPLSMLLIGGNSFTKSIKTILLSSNEIRFSFTAVFFSSLIIVVLSYYFAYIALIWKKLRNFLLFILAMLFCIPGSVVGISVLIMYNNKVLDLLYYSPILTIHVLVLRFLPIGFFITYIALSRFNNNYLDDIRLLTNNHGLIMRKILIPNTYLPIISTFFITFVLGIGELAGTIMVVPPGNSTITIKIYNYLHYGSGEDVKSLCLFVLVISLIFSTIIYLIFNTYNKRNERR